MTNYKTGWPIQKDIVLQLTTPTTTTPDAFNLEGSAYQVTTGKTFYAEFVEYNGYTNSGQCLIYQGDAENGIDLFKYTISANALNPVSKAHTEFTVASGKFVTGDPSGGNAFRTVQIIGHER